MAPLPSAEPRPRGGRRPRTTSRRRVIPAWRREAGTTRSSSGRTTRTPRARPDRPPGRSSDGPCTRRRWRSIIERRPTRLGRRTRAAPDGDQSRLPTSGSVREIDEANRYPRYGRRRLRPLRAACRGRHRTGTARCRSRSMPTRSPVTPASQSRLAPRCGARRRRSRRGRSGRGALAWRHTLTNRCTAVISVSAKHHPEHRERAGR